jgi:hypothetical protein
MHPKGLLTGIGERARWIRATRSRGYSAKEGVVLQGNAVALSEAEEDTHG